MVLVRVGSFARFGSFGNNGLRTKPTQANSGRSTNNDSDSWQKIPQGVNYLKRIARDERPLNWERSVMIDLGKIRRKTECFNMLMFYSWLKLCMVPCF